MEGILSRSGSAPVAPGLPQPRPAGSLPIGQGLLALARAVGERLVSRHREVSPEWFRFPLP